MRTSTSIQDYLQKIACTIMGVHRNVKTVLAQTSGAAGDFRLRHFVAGEEGTATLHRERGCLFSVDVERCFFSPRLSHERMRIAKQARDGETAVNMFAGVGRFSIIMSKHSEARKVYSIDTNPWAKKYVHENVKLNRAYGIIVPLPGDAKDHAETSLRGVAEFHASAGKSF